MKRFGKVISVLTVLVLITGITAGYAIWSGAGNNAETAPPPVTAVQAAITEKDEVVYARLFETGNVRSVYVVNHFSGYASAGITDYGRYTSVLNLTDLQPIAMNDDTVTVQTQSDNFYYQGYLTDNNLPWLYRIEYFLNGAPIAPKELAGKTGNLEIRLSSARNPAVSEVYYFNYMQQITITLDSDKCANINADGAAIANAGKNRMLVFTILPKHNADITVTADVRDFEMAGIDITAMPFSMNIDIPDIGDMIGDFSIMADAIADLNDGVGKLNDGVSDMAGGSEMLRDGSSKFMEGLSQLSENAYQLSDASSQIMAALSLIAESLSDSGDLTDMDSLTRLPDVLSMLANGLDTVVDGMNKSREGFTQAFAALDKAVDAIPGYQVADEQIGSLYAKANDGERELLDQLIESYNAALIVKETYERSKPAFAAINAACDAVSSSAEMVTAVLNGIAAQIGGALSGGDITGQLRQLIDGMSELSVNYSIFNSGLASFMQGVVDLAAGYVEIDEGIAGLSGGLNEISGGITELYSGTDRLAAETSDIPEQVETMVGDLTSDYTNAEFEVVSFASEKNTNVSFVQFVFKTDGISIAVPEKDADAQNEQFSFWDRLVKLFREK